LFAGQIEMTANQIKALMAVGGIALALSVPANAKPDCTDADVAAFDQGCVMTPPQCRKAQASAEAFGLNLSATQAAANGTDPDEAMADQLSSARTLSDALYDSCVANWKKNRRNP
jgi:hypothetical protein